MVKFFGKSESQPHHPSRPRSCPDCGCPLSDPSWRHCPRCQAELESCSGCGGCGDCGK